MKVLIVVNPISGGVDKEPFLKEAKELLDKYGISYRIFKTTGKNDSENLKQELNDYQPDKVASGGGDGTTLFTALTLKDTRYSMGIIPLGSANGMATELGVNPKPIEALRDIIMSENVAGLDILKINDTYHSMHIGDVGINAQIVAAYEKDPNRGMITYAKYFLAELNCLKAFDVRINSNQKTKNYKAYMVAICNSRKYGTGVPLNTDGNPMDGKFEIVVIDEINSNALVKAGLSAFNDSFMDSHTGHEISTDYAEIEFQKPRLLQLDGEVIGEFKQLKIEILKSAVKYITTTDNPYWHGEKSI